MRGLALVVLSGCATETALDHRQALLAFAPDPAFVSPIEGCRSSIDATGASPDPFLANTWVAASQTLVGHFGFTLQNVSDLAVAHVGLALTINDPARIIFPLPIRVADRLLLGDQFVLDGPPQITEDEPYHEDLRYPGKIAYLGYDRTLAPGEAVVLEALIVGLPGMELHIEAAGELGDGRFAVSTPAHEITFLNQRE